MRLARLSLVAALIVSGVASLNLSAAEPKPLRVLLITGGCCHDYPRQKDILKAGLEARAHVVVDQIHTDDKSTKPPLAILGNADYAKGYDLVIHDECSSDIKDPALIAAVLAPHRNGIPAVNLHCAMHSYRIGNPGEPAKAGEERSAWFDYLGLQSSGHGPQEPIAIAFVDPAHPVTKGLENWTTVKEELYNNIQIFPSATPLARGQQVVKNKDDTKTNEYVVAWANDYKGTRIFSTTIGHNNDTVSDERYLALVTRGLLWACGKLDDKSYLKAYVPPVRRVNIAKGKPAKASSEESNKGNLAAKAFDGDNNSRWCASGASDKEWLQVDLGAPTKLTGAKLAWEASAAIYFHQIEGSADGENWKLLVDADKKNQAGSPYEHNFKAEGIRYVRVNYLGKKGGGWGSIWEFELYGDKTEALSPQEAARQVDAGTLGEVKVPAGFEATLFAKPPMVNYPVFVSAAPDGALYVSSDGNGSLGRDPHRGRIIRLRDTNGDGKADEAKDFVKDVDSPRGLVWDHDRLYLLHPPHISVYIDKNGDGEADEERILVKNIAFTFKDRPADHTSNGLELGVDGWLYAAIGDFGFMQAEGTDGRKLQLRGGGVVRVRPDGTGLELFSRGTRNILETAVSPLLDPFARDNTNDGGGWDVRFHHFTGLEEHGYPSLYKNFNDEIIQPLADYGGGSGCGAAWIDEPGIPAKWNNAPFTCDWGRNWVYRHTVAPKGATFAETEQPAEFIGATRVTDLDVDASSHIYVASWKGATFNWVGPEAGYLVRVSPTGFKPEALPDFNKASDTELVKFLESASHRRRLEAQRTLVRRMMGGSTAIALPLTALAGDKAKPLASRIAALFAIKQAAGAKAADTLEKLTADPTIAAWAIRALTDREDQLASVPAKPLLAGLKSTDARTRKEAAVALARLGKTEHAAAVTPLLGDADPVIAHTAVQVLKRLQGADACFAVVDTLGASPGERTGALRVLAGLHDAKVVAGLAARLEKESDVARRNGLVTALCRLYFAEGEWTGDSWGTRPDTSGPYYSSVEWSGSPKIASALKSALTKAKGEEAAHIVAEFSRHKIQSDDAVKTVVALALKDPAMLPAAAAQLARAEQVPTFAIPVLVQAAISDDLGDVPRANAVIALAKTDSAEAVRAMLVALPKLGKVKKEFSNGTERERRLANEAFFNAPKLDNQHATLVAEAAKLDPETSVLADAVLLKMADRKNASPEAKADAQNALDQGWNDVKRRAQILRAVQMAEHRPYKDKVLLAMNDADKEVAKAAKGAANALKLDPAKDKPGKGGAPSPTIASLKVGEAIAAVLKTKGDVKLGEQLFTQQGCVLCHTVKTDEPQRGPYLGNIAATYKRPELAENILVPNKTLAQGFVTQHIVLKNELEYDGFVTLEAADKVVIRTVTAQEVSIPLKDIAKREKVEKSLMPEGLVANLNVKEFASLLDYLEALAKQ